MGQSVTIYAMCEPGTLDVRYVGKTVDLAARLRSHKCEIQDQRFHTHKVNWLRSLGDKEPHVWVLDVVSDNIWPDAEMYWISQMKRCGCILTNATDGGEDSPMRGKKHLQSTCEKIRTAHVKAGRRPPSRKGIANSPEARAKSSQTHKRLRTKPPSMGGWNRGMKMSDEAREKNRQAHKGKPWSAARRASHEKRKCN